MTPILHRSALFFLPLCFLVVALLVRDNAGPFWLWSNLDPDYWYLFDSLNMINLDWPRHIAHPGTTVQVIGAVVIKILHPLTGTDDLTRLVLADPERYLTYIGRVLIALNTITLLIAGGVAYRVFGSLTGAMLLQLGPFLSSLVFKLGLHVSPEPMLVTTMMVLATVMLLALRPGEMDRRAGRYVLAFAAVAGFGIATKVTSAGMYLMPVFLLARPRLLLSYGVASIAFILFFTLPAAGSYGLILDWLSTISASSGYFGEGPQTFIDLTIYPREFLRLVSRPAFSLVLVVGLVMVVLALMKGRWSAPDQPQSARALAGLCLAFLVQALLVAKHPAGHYMIPALTSAGFGFLLIYQMLLETTATTGKARVAVRGGFTILLVALIIAQGQMVAKIDREFSNRTFQATVIDETPFAACARIYYWPASNIAFALHMGSFMTGKTFAPVLKDLYPDPTIVFAAPDRTLNDWTTAYTSEQINRGYPCIFIRGASGKFLYKSKNDVVLPFDVLPFYRRKVRDYCPDWDENVMTWGIKCKKTR